MKLITIDGPSASGKTSASRGIAKKLGWLWVSTGAFYRGLAFVAKEKGISSDDEPTLAELCRSDIWSVTMSEEKTKVFFQGAEVTDEIYSEQAGAIASQISQHQAVRANLLQAQRQCLQISPQGLVAEGRDCGTVVFPQAPLKIYYHSQ